LSFCDLNKITIQIKDNGEEIPVEVLNKMGLPFYTTKVEGTGLGLAVTKSIIESHNGTIQFENSPNGTTVIIKLPVN
jgi:signal transduction histidine kinase